MTYSTDEAFIAYCHKTLIHDFMTEWMDLEYLAGAYLES